MSNDKKILQNEERTKEIISKISELEKTDPKMAYKLGKALSDANEIIEFYKKMAGFFDKKEKK